MRSLLILSLLAASLALCGPSRAPGQCPSCGVPFFAQPVSPANLPFEPRWEWRIAGEEYTLWRNGSQVGNYLPGEGFFLRLGPGRWESEPSNLPVALPEGAAARIEAALKKRCKCSDDCKCGRRCTCAKKKEKCNKGCSCGVKVIGKPEQEAAVPDRVYTGTLESTAIPVTPDCIIWLRTGRASKCYHLVLTPEQRAAIATAAEKGLAVEVAGTIDPHEYYVDHLNVHRWKVVSPAEELPGPTQDFGVETDKISQTERITINGREVTMADALEAIEKPDPSVTVPDDTAKLSLTIIGNDADRKQAVADLAGPKLATFRERVLVQEYTPDSPMLAAGFVTTGHPTIYFQAPDGTVLARVDKYDGPQTWEAVRKTDPNYDPSKDPDPTRPKPVPAPAPAPSPDNDGVSGGMIAAVVGGLLFFVLFSTGCLVGFVLFLRWLLRPKAA